MEKKNLKLDEFFRETLQHHAVVPTDESKAAFLKEAATLEENKKTNTLWYFYLPAAILLALIGAGLFILRPVHTIKKTSSEISNSTLSISPHDKTTKSNINIKQSGLHPNEIKEISLGTKHIQKITENNSHKRDEKNLKGYQVAIVQKKDFLRPDSSYNNVIKNQQAKPSSEPQANQPVTEKQPSMTTEPLSESVIQKDSLKKPSAKTLDTLLTQNSATDNRKSGTGKNAPNWNVAIGGYYAPEWMFNTLEGEKYVNNFGIEGTFHFGRYSIRTGAGLSITKGTNELSVNYNDYLGNYNKLDSIQFTWNATHSNLIPTYFFSNENVWDSLMKIADAKVVKRYTYLQIPLILGYDFWHNEHFSLGLRAGPILSVLLKTEVLSDNYDPGMNKILLINRIAPERIQTNWQFLGGFNATYHFSRRFGIELEPEIRYYFNSVYEKSDNIKKPWSAGIRVAFIVIL